MLPFQDTSLPEEVRVEDLLKRLTLEEKIHLCHQISPMKCGGVPRLGVRPVTTSDGPQGFRFEDGRTATGLPCGVSLASSWDEEAAERYGRVLGREGNALDIQVLLGPGMNLMRTPLNGRTFEYFGEDPVLSGSIAAAYVRGCQAEGVSACPKHLALNNQEICRTIGDSRIDERTMREFYLRSFQTLCRKSRPWTMMSSYNKINGTYASACGLVQQKIVKDEFGFDGVMVSDWGGAHSAEGCALGGLDLVMGQEPDRNPFAGPLLALVKEGRIPESVIDDKARRMIRLMIRTNTVNPENRPAGELNSPRNQADARKLAAEGMVLLRNDGMLPLDKKKLKKVLVIGPSADFKHNIGSIFECGGSGAVHPPYDVTPLQGIREYCGDEVEVVFHPGCSFSDTVSLPAELVRSGSERGLKTEYFASREEMQSGKAPFLVQTDSSFNYLWSNTELATGMMTIRQPGIAVRWSGQLIPRHTGKAAFCVHRTLGRVRCTLDGQVMFDEFEESGRSLPSKFEAVFDAVAGKPLDLVVEFGLKQLRMGVSVRFLWKDFLPVDLSPVRALAKDADAVIYVGGTTHAYDKEGIGWGDVPGADIPNLELPGPQAELISALADANPRLAVVLVNGSVVSMKPWLDKTAAVLEAWYPGMEGGRAVADVLFGEVEPGGRLPCSFAKDLNDYACHALGAYPGVREGDDPYVEYKEGIFVGYRHFDRAGIEPEFPFGFGLSYTRFECSLKDCRIVNDSADAPEVKVTCQVKNIGPRRGSQVIQLYVSDTVCSEERPVRELRGFAKRTLEPGGSAEVEFVLGSDDFAFWSASRKQWLVEPGEFTLFLGTSSRDLFASQTISLKA